MRFGTGAALILALGLSACAYDTYGYRYGDYRYDGRDYAGDGEAVLDPWLADTEEGRAIVAMGFTGGRGGPVSEDQAHRANIWFRRYADTDRDLRLTDTEIRLALVQGSRERY